MRSTPFSPTPLERLILYVLKETQREFGSIELAKIIYLVDIEKTKFVGETVTGEEYVREERGPLVRGFGSAIKRMVGREVQVIKKAPWGLNRWGKHCHSLGPDPRFEASLSEMDRLMADRVLRRIDGLPPRDIERMAYETEPMKAMAEQEALTGIIHGAILDFTSVSPDPDLARWRRSKKNSSKLPPDYRRFLAKERREARELIESLD